VALAGPTHVGPLPRVPTVQAPTTALSRLRSTGAALPALRSTLLLPQITGHPMVRPSFRLRGFLGQCEEPSLHVLDTSAAGTRDRLRCNRSSRPSGHRARCNLVDEIPATRSDRRRCSPNECDCTSGPGEAWCPGPARVGCRGRGDTRKAHTARRVDRRILHNAPPTWGSSGARRTA